MKRIFFILTMLSVTMLALCVYTNTVSEDLQGGIIRLHILARSNSDNDQKIKLEVRDEILKSVSDTPITDTAKFITLAEESANRYLLNKNIPYRAKAEFGTFDFPRKSYGNITLPAGKYKGVRVLLDEGKGENWWCVMYPPLCVTEKSEEATEVLKRSLSDETYKVITEKPEVKFKILELISSVI